MFRFDPVSHVSHAANVIDLDFVTEAVRYTKQILATARLDSSAGNFIIDDGFSVPATLPASIIKATLSQCRDNRNYLHIFIGSKSPDVNYLGENVAYNITSWGDFSHTECAHFASTDTFISNSYLDSTGIIIYAEQIFEQLLAQPWDTLWAHGWLPSTKTVGIVIAHEIGHALGVAAHHTTGVMRENIDWYQDSDTYMYFDTTKLNNNPPWDAMNTRDVLGIQTIDVAW